MRRKDIDILQLKTRAHQQTIGKEEAETREMESTIGALAAQRDRQVAHRDTLKRQLTGALVECERRAEQVRARREREDAQRRFDIPELDFWSRSLAMRVEGAGREDRLRF